MEKIELEKVYILPNGCIFKTIRETNEGYIEIKTKYKFEVKNLLHHRSYLEHLPFCEHRVKKEEQLDLFNKGE